MWNLFTWKCENIILVALPSIFVTLRQLFVAGTIYCKHRLIDMDRMGCAWNFNNNISVEEIKKIVLHVKTKKYVWDT